MRNIRRRMAAWPVAAAALLGFISAAPAWSDPVISAGGPDRSGPVMVENGTPRPLCGLRLTPAAAWDWSEDFFADQCLPPGRFRRLEPPDGTGRVDVLAVFDDGRSRTYYGLDLSVYRYLVFREEAAELYERAPLFDQRFSAIDR